MNEVYHKELQALRNEIEMGGARPLVIDGYVDALLIEGGVSLTEDLLSSLSDKVEDHDGMFTLIHAAESVADVPYVTALLSVFPTLVETSPRWASIVLMRGMNVESCRHELVRQLRDAPAPIKEAVRNMCDRINEISPEFLSRTVAVIIAAT